MQAGAQIKKIIRLAKRVYCRIFGYPDCIIVEPASRCNLSCAICWAYKADSRRVNHFLSYEIFKALIDEVHPFCSDIFLSFCGEPLLNSDIFRMIWYASKKNIAVGMSTNGMLLDRGSAVKLLDAGLDKIVISLDGATAVTYQSIRTGGDFDRVIEAVKYLAELKKERRAASPKIILQMVATKKNEAEAKEFISLARGLGADCAVIKSLYIDPHGGQGYVNKLATEFLPIHWICRYDKDKKAGVALKKKGPCPNSSLPVISSDGDVYGCCFDIFGEYRQGNVAKEGFCRLWNSRAYRRFRRNQMRRRMLPICGTCIYSGAPELNLIL